MRKISTFFIVIIYTCFFAQDTIKLKIYKENVGKTFILYADNDELAPVSVEFNFNAENMSSTLGNKSIAVIPANSKKYLLSELKTIDVKKGTHFNYNVFYVLGDVNAGFAESGYVYNLPFAKNKRYIIYQGYNGLFSHRNTYSLDFSLQTGDEVFAAREGKVVQITVNNSKNCMTKDCAKLNNKIIIMHNDGTFAEYVHLNQNGAKVKIGENVERNQLIGYSGNTGWSKGPHLHFSVFTPKIDGERNYIKTKFKVDGSKDPVYLEEKKSYSRSL